MRASFVSRAAAPEGLRSDSPRGLTGGRVTARALTPAHAVYAAAGVFAALFAAADALRYESYNARRFDLGNMTQAVWNTAHGRFLESTTETGEQVSRLGSHVDPLLAALALPWLAWPSPLLLVTVQAVAIALGALPVFWLARKHLGSEGIAAAFAFAYLLYPSTQWNAHFEFHPVSLAIPLLLFAIWYLDEDRFLAFLPFGVAAAATKEHMGLLVAWLGVWYALRHGRRLLGACTAAVGLAWLVIAAFILLPHFAPTGVDVFADRYGAVGGSPGGIAKTLVTDPLLILRELTTSRDVAYVVVLLVPFAGLWALSPLLAAGALPELGLDLLSSKPEQTDILYQYSAAIGPFVVAASVLGAARLKRGTVRRLSAVVLGLMAAFLIYSPLWRLPRYVADLRSPAHAARVEAVSLIPDGAPVAATNELGGHLSERRRILVFPNHSAVDWIVADANDTTYVGAGRVALETALATVRHDRSWLRLFARDGILVLRRVGASPRS
jgi:uncharacterized membrane protein